MRIVVILFLIAIVGSLGSALYYMVKDRDDGQRMFRALALPDPDSIGERYPHQVSGGQLQRLSAAMALIGGPKLVIFDEPTTALDVTTQIEVLRAFKSVMKAGGMGGVYVSHDLAVVAQIADRIVVLRGGEVQETGTTADILENPQHPYTRDLLAAFHPVTHAAVAAPDPKPISMSTGTPAPHVAARSSRAAVAGSSRSACSSSARRSRSDMRDRRGL